MTKKLLKRDVAKRLKALGAGWELVHDDSALSKTFVFDNFLDAFMFVTRLGIHAEVLKHYPVITLHKNTVHISITTASSATVTLADFSLAERAVHIVALSTVRKEERLRRK